MKTQHFIRSIARVIICSAAALFLAEASYAGVESVSTYIKGNQVSTSAVVSVKDFQYDFMAATAQSSWFFKNKKAEGWLIAGVDRSNTTYVGASYNVDLIFSVQQWSYNYGTSAFDASAVSNYTLQVSYDPAAASNEFDRSAHLFAEAHRMSISLLHVYNHGTTTVPAGGIPQNLYVDGVINAERYHDFDETAVPSAPGYTVYDVNADGFKDEMEVHWGYIPGAEEYDLEWTFINDYHTNGAQSSAAAASSIPFSAFDFDHNCTRVRVTDQYYRIPLVMDRGYVIYRVRGIGRGGVTAGVDFDKIVPGKWSNDFSAYNDVGDISSSHKYYNSNSYGGDGVNGGHEKKKNWQITSTFAEEGKKKEVISYFDGTLRNRQTVTRINSADSIVLIGETMYDHQGRAAIQTLPAPTSIANKGSTAIKFYPYFNVNLFGAAYSRYDFDLDNISGACTLTVSPMDSSIAGNVLAGASRYYSSENDLVFSHRDYIPMAKGFPFTMVEYQPDNTNRIRTQTGTGNDHKLTSGHETKYFYGQPEQEQLDRLFATEAGYSQHYKKNMVIDANGQVSVNYLDMQGRTIATSLAGDTASSASVVLLALKDPVTGTSLIAANSQTITVDLLNKDNINDKDTHLDNNKISTDSTTLTYSAQKLVTARSSYDYFYSLTAPSFSVAACSPACYPAVYDLEIHVKDQCGDEWLQTPVSTLTFTPAYLAAPGYTVTSNYHDCNDLSFDRDKTDGLTSDDPNSASAEKIPGVYTVEKVLKVNAQAIETLSDQYLADVATTTCVLTYEDFKDYNLANEIHLDDCDITCDECVGTLTVTLGSIDTYTATAACAADPAACAAQWNAIYEECTAACKPISLCQTGYEMMLRDVSPGGQYGATAGPDFAISVFNTNNQLPNNNHNWLYPSPPYADDLGQASLIVVVPSASAISGFEPKVNTGSNVTLINGKYYTRPQYLADPGDFLDVWEPSWAKSLVKYHPEYEYFKWCDPLGEVCSSTFTYTSDDFDYALMAINSYTAAQSATIGTSTVTVDLTNMTNFLSKDPFFTNGTTSCIATYGGMTDPCSGSTYTQLITNAFNSYQSTGMSMHKFAAYTANCGSWYAANVSACPGYTFTFGQGTATQDQEWNLFKSFYLSKKQELMQRAADNYIVNSYTASPTADFNYGGCIGEQFYSPFIPCTYAPKNFFDHSFPWGSSDEGALDANQPCSFFDYSLYANKARRFGWADLWVPVPTSSTSITGLNNNTDYQLYQQTGVCPIALHLKTWLNDMVPLSGFTSTNIPLFGIQGFIPKLYTHFGGNPTTFTSYTWTPTASATTLSVSISPTPAGICTANPVMTLTLPGSTTLAWNSGYGSSWKINSFTDISPVSSNSFTIKADVDDDNNATTPSIGLVLGGSTGGCINLTDCASTFTVLANADCEPSDEAKDLQELMNLLSGFGDINNTTGVAINDAAANAPISGMYKTVFNRKLISYLSNPTSTGWKWKQTNPSNPVRYEIFNTSYSDKLKIEINTTSAIGTGALFTNINSSAAAGYNFSVDISGIGTGISGFIKDISYIGETEYSVNVNMGDCDYPNNCKTAEHHFAKDLLPLLNAYVQSLPSGTPDLEPNDDSNNGKQFLTGTPWFTVQMQNFLAKHGSENFASLNGVIDDDEFSIKIMDNDSLGAGIYCNIDLFPVNATTTAPAPTYSLILSFSNLQVDENTLVNGKAYEFTIDALVGSTTYKLRGRSCFPLKNCKDCIPSSPNPLRDCITEYDEYLVGLNELGIDIDPGDPAFVMDIETFCDFSLENCWQDYINYLDAVNCTTATQNTYISLADFCKGHYGNCSTEYVTYYASVSSLLATVPGLFVSLSDFCQQGITQPCLNSYTVYISNWGEEDPETRIAAPYTVLQFCEGYPVASYCDPAPPTVPTHTMVTPPDPCVAYQNALGAANALASYNLYIKSIKDKFKHDYVEHCITRAVERFEMTYTDKEYNFTLFYFDNGNNLVRTIPPAGVQTLSLAATYTGSVTVGEQIKQDRANNTRNVYTHHAFPTTYRYNSLNQLTAQGVPDNTVLEGTSSDVVLDNFSTRFYYDNLGRLIASQNSKQYHKQINHLVYSYTLYDELGRIKEVGEVSDPMSPCPPCNQPPDGDPCPPCDPVPGFIEGVMNGSGVIIYAAFEAWVEGGTRSQVTKTFYDEPIISSPGGIAQDNLRNRVSSITFQQLYDTDSTVFDYAHHFDCDVHGNSKTIVQDNPSLSTISPSQRYKTIGYEYDLISGNVNEVRYQQGYPDQFFHKYEYDADNRITNVYTSKDQGSIFPTFQLTASLWDQDAKYFYYPHGLLARTELGNHKVNGMDFAYTIQGWIKGVNSNALKATHDIGKDGYENSGNLDRYIARDAFGYSLRYFPTDYYAIGNLPQATHFIADVTDATYLATDAPALFNGNISSMVTTITDPTTNIAKPQLTAYRYDQLNRIKQMKAYRDFSMANNEWGDGSTYDGSYQESYKYDHNGNILKLKRNGLASIASGQMDDLKYYFYDMSGGIYNPETTVPPYNATNKRAYITDAVSSGTYTDDMNSQSSGNYDYDEIGNLIKDDFECIQNIEWTVYGKVSKVTRTPSCTTEGTAMPDLEFKYTPSGKLREKIVKPAATLTVTSTWIHTYYIHDASGNILATYEKEGSDFTLTEHQLYGSAHIGTHKLNVDMTTATVPVTSFNRALGEKQYFLGDHRGNNNVTLQDQKQPVESVTTPGTIAYFEPAIDRAVDYFPFGRELNGRIFNKDNSEFGYNGKQNIKEWSARLGGAQLYGMRIKSGEGFLSVDPLTRNFPWFSPYIFAGNTPIQALDLDGLEILDFRAFYRLKLTATDIQTTFSAEPEQDAGEPSYFRENNITLKPRSISTTLHKTFTDNLKATPLIAQQANNQDAVIYDATQAQIDDFMGSSMPGGFGDANRAKERAPEYSKQIPGNTFAVSRTIEGASKSLYDLSQQKRNAAYKDLNNVINAYNTAFKVVEQDFGLAKPNALKITLNSLGVTEPQLKAAITQYVVDGTFSKVDFPNNPNPANMQQQQLNNFVKSVGDQLLKRMGGTQDVTKESIFIETKADYSPTNEIKPIATPAPGAVVTPK